MKVFMVPSPTSAKKGVGGINTLIAKYAEHFPKFGMEIVGNSSGTWDIMAVHAGAANKYTHPLVAHLHGLYWTEDMIAESVAWEWAANKTVVESIRQAQAITVPSEWVAEVIRREVRISPTIIPHGIDWADWNPSPSKGYVLWNKNRAGDVCTTVPLTNLARLFPDRTFVSTFSETDTEKNIQTIGTIPHNRMKSYVEQCAVYLATTKETFGIGTLEAMASAKPVLGFAHGGNNDLVIHGVTGYLARPGNIEDLAQGLRYCLKHAKTLGENGRERAKQFGWEAPIQALFNLYTRTIQESRMPSRIAVVIPCYNYAEFLPRAVESALSQTRPPDEVIIVDNNSTDSTSDVALRLCRENAVVRYVNESQQGVAHARNRGATEATSDYVVCLDADDRIAPSFLEMCSKALDTDPSLGIAYTRLRISSRDGTLGPVSEWPSSYDFDGFLQRKNQVPTCCMFRRKDWERLGGFRQRYAPHGQGAEDAEFWMRLGAMGRGGRLVTNEPLFIYSVGGRTSQAEYSEPDWHALHPWTKDKRHPIASLASPSPYRSHPVRQYDNPLVSVIIPVGPGREDDLVDALDSLESQVLRKWEVIVVADGCTIPENILVAYPYIHLVQVKANKGPGYARNRGVERARAPLILFLDSDDALVPEALASMYNITSVTGAITYSDYLGKAIVADLQQVDRTLANRVVKRDENTGKTLFRYKALPFDRERTYSVEDPPYLWANVTCMLPKSLHNKIGGFDESMSSWEDVDYHYRLAHICACYHHIPVPLLVYNFSSGSMRERGRQNWENLIEYMRRKYEGVERMGCGCGGSSRPIAPLRLGVQQVAEDDSLVRVQLHSNNTASQPVMQAPAVKVYKVPGDVFYVTPDVFARFSAPRPTGYWFSRVEPEPVTSAQVEEKTPPPPAPPPALSTGGDPADKLATEILSAPDKAVAVISGGELDLVEDLPGISHAVANNLRNAGFATFESIASAKPEQLVRVKGIGGARAQTIIREALKRVG